MAGHATINHPVIGIDLGGTHMQVGAVDSVDRLISRTRAKTNARDGLDAVLARITECIDDVRSEASLALTEIASIGIAAPGAIDIPNGIVLEAPNLGWRDVPLQAILKERFKLPIVLDNDVNAAVLGEHRLGAGRGTTDLLGIWVGTGVGGGLIINKQLHHGAFHTAGEVGHTVINPDGKPGYRTIEDHISRVGMSRIIQDRLAEYPDSILHNLFDQDTGRVSSSALAKAIDEDDALAADVINRGAYLLGVGIANLVTVLAIDRVVIGGGITETLGEPFVQKIRTAIRDNVFPARCRDAELRMTELEADAGLLGAAMLARSTMPVSS